MAVRRGKYKIKPKFICGACNERFYIKSYLDDHLYSHIKGKSLINEVCCKGFSEISELNEYFRNYMIKNSRTCDTCSTTFFAKSDLNEHPSVCTSSYVCEPCRGAIWEGMDGAVVPSNKFHVSEYIIHHGSHKKIRLFHSFQQEKKKERKLKRVQKLK